MNSNTASDNLKIDSGNTNDNVPKMDFGSTNDNVTNNNFVDEDNKNNKNINQFDVEFDDDNDDISNDDISNDKNVNYKTLFNRSLIVSEKKQKYDFKLLYRPEEINPSDSIKVINERKFYSLDKLTQEQKHVYDYILKNPHDIIVVQAGPGSGKTHTLLTICYNLKRNVNVLIFKHDLLRRFSYCGCKLWTVTKLFMNIFSMNYFEYQAFEKQLSGNLSTYEYLFCVNDLLNRMTVPFTPDSLVILDEYTVISKSLLFILLLKLKILNIGVIICGDQYQLQNIFNTRNAKYLSSFDIAKSFSNKIFSLSKNIRNSNEMYNEKINYVKQFSSGRQLDTFAYCLIGALYTKKCLQNNNVDLTETFLAGTHSELARELHLNIMNNNTSVTQSNIIRMHTDKFIQIIPINNDGETIASTNNNNQEPHQSSQDQSSSKDQSQSQQNLQEQSQPQQNLQEHSQPQQNLQEHSQQQVVHSQNVLPQKEYIYTNNYIISVLNSKKSPNLQSVNGMFTFDPQPVIDYVTTNTIDKFVPYLPLIINCKYFLRKHSEFNLCTLIKHDVNEKIVQVRHEETGQLELVTLELNNDVVFEEHRNFLLGEERLGRLYNYPLYLANYMTIHMAQGRTITNRVNIFLENTTYQGLYVAMSRVTSPDKINYVSVKDQSSVLLSTILNFGSLVEKDDLTLEEIKSVFDRGYLYFDLTKLDDIQSCMNYYIVSFFFNKKNRMNIRNILMEYAVNLKSYTIGFNCNSPSTCDDDTGMSMLIDHKDIFYGLSRIKNKYDCSIWIKEFLNSLCNNRKMSYKYEYEDPSKYVSLRTFCDFNKSYNPNETTLAFINRIKEYKPKLNPVTQKMEQHYIKDEDDEDETYVFVVSQFQKKVYDYLTKNIEKKCIPLTWLVTELNHLVERQIVMDRVEQKLMLNMQLPSSSSSSLSTLSNGTRASVLDKVIKKRSNLFSKVYKPY